MYCNTHVLVSLTRKRPNRKTGTQNQKQPKPDIGYNADLLEMAASQQHSSVESVTVSDLADLVNLADLMASENLAAPSDLGIPGQACPSQSICPSQP